jgi:hypothetical protein
MTLADYQQSICNTLAPVLQPHEIAVLAENAMDIDSEISAALGAVGCCAIVMTPELTYLGRDDAGNIAWELAQLVVAVREHVPINRARPGAITAMDAALMIVETLASDTVTPTIIRQREFGGELLCDVTLQTSQFITANTQEEN